MRKKSTPTAKKQGEEEWKEEKYPALTMFKLWQTISKQKNQRFLKKIWSEHVWQRQTVSDLKEKYS